MKEHIKHLDEALDFIISANKVNTKIDSNIAMRCFLNAGRHYDKKFKELPNDDKYYLERHKYQRSILNRYLIKKMYRVENLPIIGGENE